MEGMCPGLGNFKKSHGKVSFSVLLSKVTEM